MYNKIVIMWSGLCANGMVDVFCKEEKKKVLMYEGWEGLC